MRSRTAGSTARTSTPPGPSSGWLVQGGRAGGRAGPPGAADATGDPAQQPEERYGDQKDRDQQGQQDADASGQPGGQGDECAPAVDEAGHECAVFVLLLQRDLGALDEDGDGGEAG